MLPTNSLDIELSCVKIAFLRQPTSCSQSSLYFSARSLKVNGLRRGMKVPRGKKSQNTGFFHRLLRNLTLAAGSNSILLVEYILHQRIGGNSGWQSERARSRRFMSDFLPSNVAE